MDEQISVMILGGSQSINSSLRSDLGVLGFKPLTGRYPDVDTDDITQSAPGVILLDLTVCNSDALSTGELLSNDNSIPAETAPIALISENTMGQIPMDYKFADFIKFPYDIAELGFRLRRAIYLYHQKPDNDTICIGSLSFSPSRYQVKVKGQPVVLSHKEYELFKHLITHPNRVFTRKRLLSSIWDDNLINNSRTVDVHIRRVRAKIGDVDHNYIKTIRSVGYAFRFDGD